MKYLILVASLFAGGFASAAEDSEITRIENPSYTCGADDASSQIVFSIGGQGQGRVWVTTDEPGMGLEYSDVRVQLFRCMNCVNFTGNVTLFGMTAEQTFIIRGDSSKKGSPPVLSVRIDGKLEESGIPCKRVPRQ